MLDPKTIRNVAIIAHDGAGKTALTEALLRHDAPARASKDGSTSHLDVDPEEWMNEVERSGKFLATFSERLPKAIQLEHEALTRRLRVPG